MLDDDESGDKNTFFLPLQKNLQSIIVTRL